MDLSEKCIQISDKEILHVRH
ncbi:hypothetical protein EMIT0111MI5_290020 [Burkholderia sp. IT-111MI5]